jgi:YHS domain-containing protein
MKEMFLLGAMMLAGAGTLANGHEACERSKPAECPTTTECTKHSECDQSDKCTKSTDCDQSDKSAECSKSDKSSKPAECPTTAPTTQEAAKPINKFCAIQGEGNPIDPEVTVVYKGQTIGFCCSDCIAEFQKDPEKYMKNLK